MTRWIEQKSGRPGEVGVQHVTIPMLDAEVWFTEDGYAETTPGIAALLDQAFADVRLVEEPTWPGETFDARGELTVAVSSARTPRRLPRPSRYDARSLSVQLDLDGEPDGAVDHAFANVDTLNVQSDIGGIDVADLQSHLATASGYVPRADGDGGVVWQPAGDGGGGGGGGGGYAVIPSVSGDHTASDGEFVLADASAGPLTVTLPAPAEGLLVGVKKVDASGNGVTVATPGTQTIDGQASVTITGRYTSREHTSDGTNYWIL